MVSALEMKQRSDDENDDFNGGDDAKDNNKKSSSSLFSPFHNNNSNNNNNKRQQPNDNSNYNNNNNDDYNININYSTTRRQWNRRLIKKHVTACIFFCIIGTLLLFQFSISVTDTSASIFLLRQEEEQQHTTLQYKNNNNNNKQQQQQQQRRQEQQQSLPSYTWNDKGCMEWPRQPPPLAKKSDHNNNIKYQNTTNEIGHSKKSLSSSSSSSLFLLPQTPPPTGMVVTMATSKKEGADTLLELLCTKVPTQLAYFMEPHGIDLLLLLDIEGVHVNRIIECLELQTTTTATTTTTTTTTTTANPPNMKTWINLDNTTMTTYEYTTKSGRAKVFLSPNYVTQFPKYIQQNMSILDEPMLECTTYSIDYIQGCRYYSDQFLHLQILEQYEYMLKVDLDIEFKQAVPFNMLWDMKQRGALFGHTGEFIPTGLKLCTTGIQNVMNSFANEFGSSSSSSSNTTSSSWAQHWKGPCSAGIPEFDRGRDQYYTNFIVLNREFFQSEPVRAYGRWMNEYNPGYFKYRWGDQLFFHIAMGMFLGPDFRDYVWDYTHLRCRRFPNCWFFWVGSDGHTFKRSNFCQVPGGVFAHGKVLNLFGKFRWNHVPRLLTSPMIDHELMTTNNNNNSSNNKHAVDWYQHDCQNLEEQERKLLASTKRKRSRINSFSRSNKRVRTTNQTVA